MAAPAPITPESVWSLSERKPAAEARLERELGVPRLLAVVLVSRGYADPSQAERFLDPRLEDMHDPRLLPDYEAAEEAILGAIERKERIFVNGDYDVDGVTSASLFTRFLRKLGASVIPHVPHRHKHGYGIHEDAVEAARVAGAKLFLTSDCGVGDHNQVAAAMELGMAVVVTDHHEVPKELPEAHAIVNPHRRDSQYPFAGLSGAGVAFKLCQGLAAAKGFELRHYWRAYLDLAVLGTVADVMDLVDENRIITRHGLVQLRESKKLGIQALLDVCGLRDPSVSRLRASDIGFQIGPRINAVGRLDDAGIALNLLLTEDAAEAGELANVLDQMNTERRAQQHVLIKQAVAAVEALDELPPVLLLHDEAWNQGIVGLAAGKLVEKFHRPAFVSTEVDGKVKGSARTIPPFPVGEVIDRVRPLLLSGGGHAMAAGFSLEPKHRKAFTDKVVAIGRETLTDDHFRPYLKAEAELAMEEAGPDVAEALDRLEPFGNGNPTPKFVCRNLELVSVAPKRNPVHAGYTVAQGGASRSGMTFGMGESLAALLPGTRMDVMFDIDTKPFNGRPQFTWVLRDYKLL